MAIAYFADADNTNKIYLTHDPSPVPLLKYDVTSSKRKTLNTRDGAGIVPGQWHHYTGGTHISGGTIDVQVLKMSRTDYVSLISKITSQAGTVIFSPDNGTTKYLVIISDLTGLTQIDGTEEIAGAIVLNVLSVS